MPHATFEMATAVTADALRGVRQIVPGVEPGGSRVGQPVKPALLIRDAWIELIDLVGQSVNDFNQMTGYLKLSQEQGLNPGFLIGVAQVGSDTQTGAGGIGLHSAVRSIFHEHGTVWAPKYIGAAWFEQGTMTLRATMHLEYEIVQIPWIEWFVKWEFLDSITDNAEEH